jgi:hypothetical protein
VASLPFPESAVLDLEFFEGLRLAAVARRLGLSRYAMRAARARGLVLLTTMLFDRKDPPEAPAATEQDSND